MSSVRLTESCAAWLGLGLGLELGFRQVDRVLCRLRVDIHVGRRVGREDLPDLSLPERDHRLAARHV